jgi:hypothetical protein
VCQPANFTFFRVF